MTSVKTRFNVKGLFYAPMTQEPTPPIELYFLTEASTEETPGTPSRKRKAAADNAKLKKTRLN